MTNSQVHPQGWISLLIAQRYEERAKQMRVERDRKYGNIYREATTDARWVGDLGEIVFKSWLKHEHIQKFEWVLDDTAGKPDFVMAKGTRIGVKTVKRQGPPLDHYTAQITARHADEPIDQFFFMSYEIPKRLMWMLGGIEKKQFLDKSTYYKSGEKVHGNYPIRDGHAIFNTEIKNLIRPKVWIEQMK